MSESTAGTLLHIRLFGVPTVTGPDGTVLSIPRRQTRALLYYLAAQGTPVRRERILSLFWLGAGRGPQDEHKARRDLTFTLSRLRAALGDATLVRSDGEHIDLDLERFDVDLLEFDRLMGEIGQQPWLLPAEVPLPADLAAKMQQAAAVCQAGVFLQGSDLGVSHELELWRQAEQNRLCSQSQRLLERLYRHERAAGDLARACRWLQQAGRAEMHNEDLQSLLLGALLEAGLQQDARHHFKALEAHYRAEQSPLPESLLVFRGALGEREDVRRTRAAIWALRPAVEAPFVGRQHCLQQLREWHRLGGAVVVSGEAGQGKTRLVREFYDRLDPAPRLMLGNAHPLEHSLPYQPWVEMLRRDVSRDEWRALGDAWLGALSILMPELRQQLQDPAVTVPGSDRPRGVIFEAVRQLLLQLARSRPLLVFLDDVHWADESSMGLAAYLLDRRFFEGPGAALVMCFRPEEPSQTLDQFLFAYPAARLHRIQLSSLEPQEVVTLSRHVLGQEPPESFTDRLVRDTGGNPLFILEILQQITVRGRQVKLDDLHSLPMAGSISQLVQSRLQALSPAVRAVLLLAAVVGSHFEQALLEAALPEHSPSELADILDELVDRSFIRPEGRESEGHYIFVHEKLYEGLLESMSPAQARHLNRRIAEVLESRLQGRTTQQAALLAHHFEAAGSLSRAFDFWVQSGRYSGYLSSTDAVTAFQRAERLIPRADLSDEQIYSLYSSWTDMAFEVDDAETVLKLNQTLLQIGQERGSDLLIGNALDGLGEGSMAANRFAEGLAYTEDALHYLERAGNLFEMLESTIHKGVFLYMIGHLAESQAWFQQVVDQSGDAADLALLRSRGNALYQLAITSTLMGYPRQGLEHARAALEEHTRARWLYGRVSAYSALGLSSYLLGDYTGGVEACQKGIELAERMRGWRMLGYLHAYAAFSTLMLGQLGASWTHGQKAVEIGERFHHNEIAAIGQRALGDVYICLLDLPRACHHYQLGVVSGGQDYVALDPLTRLGYALCFSGDPNGLGMMQQAVEKSHAIGVHIFAYFAKVMQLSALLHTRQIDWFDRQLEEMEQVFDTRLGPGGGIFCRYLRIERAFILGQDQAALAQFEALLPYLAQFKLSPWTGLRALNLYFSLLERLGQDPSPARQQMNAYFEQLDIGAAPLQAELDAYKALITTSAAPRM